MLVCAAHCWAALRIWSCQAFAEPNLALNVDTRLLVTPPRLVPSGMKADGDQFRMRPNIAGGPVGDFAHFQLFQHGLVARRAAKIEGVF